MVTGQGYARTRAPHTESAHMLLSILHTALTLASTVGHTIGTLGAKW
jgi:hypothetical protein